MDMGGQCNRLVQNVGKTELTLSADAPATVILHEQGEVVPTPYNLIDVTGGE